MAWSALSITAPTTNADTETAELAMHSITPWQHGEGQGIHARLSFPNAAELLANKVSINTPALAIAISAATFTDFANQCAQLIAPFPLPLLQQWQRRATELAALEKSKLDLVQQQKNTGGTAINSVPAIQTVQEADLRKQAFDDAESFKSSNPLTNLTNFQTEKTAHDTDVAGAQAAAKAGLTGGAGWRFYAASDVANALQNNTPGSEYTLTAIVVFQGSVSDLALLTEIIQ